MFNPEFKKTNFKKAGMRSACAMAPSCDCWWDQNSECTCSTGCITSSWTQTASNT